MGLLVAHPLMSAMAVSVAGFGVAAFILRWEIRSQARRRRHGGFLIGGDR